MAAGGGFISFALRHPFSLFLVVYLATGAFAFSLVLARAPPQAAASNAAKPLSRPLSSSSSPRMNLAITL